MQQYISVDFCGDDINRLDKKILASLLKDRTTKKNILWGTDDYSAFGAEYNAGNEIRIENITGPLSKVIQPRVLKGKNQKEGRTRKKAEVFTPLWICNAQNNLVDELWFGKSDSFNCMEGTNWSARKEVIQFEENGKRTWQRYVDAKRLEITCGEAPYLVSRYDSVTGKTIPIKERIGLLDRKFRVVNENTKTKEDWIKWAIRAVESIYGYEFQGDSLLLARENILYSYIEYYRQRFNEDPEIKELQRIALVISWNLWQMDGFNYAVPFCEETNGPRQMTIFDYLKDQDIGFFDYGLLKDTKGQELCKIRDWRSKETILYKNLVKEYENE